MYHQGIFYIYSWLSITRNPRDWAFYFERNGIRVMWICRQYFVIRTYTCAWLNVKRSRFVIVDSDNAAIFNRLNDGKSLTISNYKWTKIYWSINTNIHSNDINYHHHHLKWLHHSNDINYHHHHLKWLHHSNDINASLSIFISKAHVFFSNKQSWQLITIKAQ
jgi:hypothetical protein